MNVGGGARIYRSDGCGSIVKVDDFGRVTLMTGATEIGQGSDVVLAQMLAEELGVTPEDVTVINNDTAVCPWDVGCHASRTTFIAGNSALIAAREAKRQILETASSLAKVPAAELVLRDGQVFRRGEDAPLMPIAKAIRSRHFRVDGQAVVGHGWYEPPTEMLGKDLKGNISVTYGWGAQSAEVEVDTETGRVRVLRMVAAHDVGRAINPMYVEGQVEGGIHMGLGYALTEEVRVEEGRVLNHGISDYSIFTAMDMPGIEVVIVETNDADGPYGAKGVGEMGTTPVAAAVANAIHDAVGVRMRSLPMLPEKIVEALHGKTEEE
jgi:xanthine dehydrogenase molybdenum-binding subunit